MITDKIELVLPSSMGNIHQVERFVEGICDEFNINNTYFGNILVALTEAVENAIKHGNKNNNSKAVTIVFSSKPDGFSFLISDEGNGFDLNQIPDPTDPNTDPEEQKGRGIFLMRNLADEINFNGNNVELIFKISSINKEMSKMRIKQLQQFFGSKEAIASKTKNKSAT